ncbi:hypothetical protein D3C72_1241150 [compost metagenome]
MHQGGRFADLGLRRGVRLRAPRNAARKIGDGRQRRIQFMRKEGQRFFHRHQALAARGPLASRLHGQLQRRLHGGQVERLFQQTEQGATVDQLEQHVLVRIRGHQHADDVRIALRHFLQQLAAQAVRHAVIGDEHVYLAGLVFQQGQRRIDALRR